MSFEPTNEQRAAIDSDGSIIVSAAAGSGKTAVLVERVIRLLTDDTSPVDADKLLVVTFTNAAAAELRSRIEARINEECEKRNNNYLLQRQKMLLNSAKICTIDSFCIDFIKENYELSGLSPSFKIADNTVLASLENSAMSQLMNEYFEKDDKAFLDLFDFFGDDYDDSKLRACIFDIFEFSRHMPFPNIWLNDVLNNYRSHAEGKSDVWFTAALSEIEELAEEAAMLFGNAIKNLELSEPAYTQHFANYESFFNLCETIRNLSSDGNWDELYNAVSNFKPSKSGRLSADDKDEHFETAYSFREQGKKVIDKIKALLYSDKEEIRREFAYVLPFIEKVIVLVKEFENKLYSLLAKQDLITFYIAEQKALEMLAENVNGTILPSQLADTYAAKYKMIMVDEYQDTNTLQDALFTILSGENRNLFIVGDMKQCIYKFRGSNPSNFLYKKNNARSIEARSENDFLRIDLGCNFRSREEVCEFINSVFVKLLYKKTSDFDYDDNEKLIPAAKYPENSQEKVECHFVDLNSVCESGSEKIETRAEAEAVSIAETIIDLVNRPPFLRSENGLRKAEFKDITILLRNMRSKGSIYIDTLKRYGIPVSAASDGVLKSDEVKTLISILKIINNPTDDIALLTVMTSDVFGFSVNELADIRSKNKYGNIISSVTTDAKHGGKKSAAFLNIIESLRKKNVLLTVAQLIEEIFEEVDLLNAFKNENSDVVRLNLLCVQNMAISFEREGRKSLRSFLAYIEILDDKDFSVSSDSADGVTVMSIHKSKGLQFPICILANTSNQFNQQDIRDSVIINEKDGFSVSYFDSSGNKKKGNLLKSVMASDEKKQLYAEELRILYVALTRAEEKLLVFSTYNSIDEAVKKKQSEIQITNSAEKLSYTVFKHSSSYADWLLASLIMDGYGSAVLGMEKSNKIFLHKTFSVAAKEATEPVKAEPNPKAVADLKRNYACTYPFADLLTLQSKSSVTDIVHKADDRLFAFTKRPAFLQEKGLNSAEKGTAVHKFMQYADFVACKTNLTQEINRLYEYMYLNDAEYDSIDVDVIKAFFDSDLFKRIESASFVKREMKFITEFPATVLDKSLPEKFADENVIVQGAVDLIFEENGHLVIVDFKTDRNKNEDDLAGAYQQQLEIYAKACEKLLAKPVGQLILYSFNLKKAITL